MSRDKQIEEMAVEILEEYTNCYSEGDQECLEKMLYKLTSDIRADTVRKMRELIRQSLPQLLMDSSYLDVLNEEHWIPAADQLFNGIVEITEEMIEDAE